MRRKPRTSSALITLALTLFVSVGTVGSRPALGQVPVAPHHLGAQSILETSSHDVPHQPLPQAFTGVQTTSYASPTTDPAADSFWHNGIAGVCGARTVWWGRLIAVFLFALGMIYSGAITGAQVRYQMHQAGMLGAAPTVALISTAINLAISYILFWGVPADALGYGLMAFDWLFMGNIAAVVAVAE